MASEPVFYIGLVPPHWSRSTLVDVVHRCFGKHLCPILHRFRHLLFFGSEDVPPNCRILQCPLHPLVSSFESSDLKFRGPHQPGKLTTYQKTPNRCVSFKRTRRLGKPKSSHGGVFLCPSRGAGVSRETKVKPRDLCC